LRLVLLGAPGSGKGTQSAALARHYDIPHISSGELLRSHVARRTRLGDRIRASLERGDLVPDALVLEVVGDSLSTSGTEAGYVLDGFPRTVAQARQAFIAAQGAGVTADAVISLDLPDNTARDRLAARAQSDRPDDANPAAVERRLEVFRFETGPLLDYYRERGILVSIDAAPTAATVTLAILEALTDREL
jgi:adenylate kinase